MGKGEGRHLHSHSDTEVIGGGEPGAIAYSGPLSGPLNNKINKRGEKKSPRFTLPSTASGKDPDEPYLEVTLDVHDDSTVQIRSLKSTHGAVEDDPERTPLAQRRNINIGNMSSGASSVVRNASSRIKQEFKKLASFSRRPGRLDRTKSAAAHALMGLKFISKTDGVAGWAAVEKKFEDVTAPTDGLLPRARFCECIGMKESDRDFAEALFNTLARKRNIQKDSICKAEFKEFWEQISDQSFDARLQTFFDMVDKDENGRITEEEVREIITLSASSNNLKNLQKKAEEYARLIMEELDPENHGYIMIENLEMLLLQGPNESTKGESRNMSQMLSEKLKPTQNANPLRRWYKGTKYFLLDNWQRVWVMALWIGVMVGLFAYKFIQYRHKAAYQVMGTCLCVAKGAAETLKFNMALILLPVCRNTLTWLRNNSKLGIVVPFDDNLNFHKVIAVGIALGVAIHSIAHLTCDFPRLLRASPTKWELVEKDFGHQPKSYSHYVDSTEGISGIAMVLLMAIAFTLAAPCFRRNTLKLPTFLKKLTGFNAFWYSHHLFVIVYALLLIHGFFLYLTHKWYEKTTWMYLAVPVTLYAVERLTRALRSSIKPVNIQKVAIYTGNVLSLHMSRPQGFRYKSGQYMFVNCAAVSPFEWHPFSLTSAPGDDYLSVHIKVVGDWTRQLRDVFSMVCHPPSADKSGLLRADCCPRENNYPNFPRVLIDGPYGAPAQDYKNYEVLLLVGLGIGATPLISILKDIISNIREIEEEENNAQENGIPLSPNALKRKENFKIRRAYFYWVTNTQPSFDWFKDVMDEVAELDHNHVIELNNHCSSVYEEGDARSALIAMIQCLNHAKNGVDIVSGTRVKCHFAKPNWRSVYKHVAVNHADARVGVFYCGNPALAKDLRHLALDFSHRTSTKFDFHKENF